MRLNKLNILLIVLNISLAIYILLPTKPTTIIKHTSIKQAKILSELSYISKYLKVDLLVVKFNKNKVSLSLFGKFKEVMRFFYILDNMTQIISVKFHYDKILFADIEFDKNSLKAFDYKHIKLPSPPNIFTPPRVKRISNAKAIIGDYVYLEGKWYKKGDKYKGFIINEIYKDYIILKKNDQTTKLELFDEFKY